MKVKTKLLSHPLLFHLCAPPTYEMEERRTSTAWDSEPSLPHQWSPSSRNNRYAHLSSSRVLLRVGIAAGLACVASVAILASVRQDAARPIEDYIMGTRTISCFCMIDGPGFSSCVNSVHSASCLRYLTWFTFGGAREIGKAVGREDARNNGRQWASAEVSWR